MIFEIEFFPKTFFTNTSGNYSLNSFDIVTEEITIENPERTYLKNTKYTFITDIVKKHPTLEIKSGEQVAKMELVPKTPVKTINWFFRQTTFEDENTTGGGNTIKENAFANKYAR
jgi:hypothetical protein